MLCFTGLTRVWSTLSLSLFPSLATSCRDPPVDRRRTAAAVFTAATGSTSQLFSSSTEQRFERSSLLRVSQCVKGESRESDRPDARSVQTDRHLMPLLRTPPPVSRPSCAASRSSWTRNQQLEQQHHLRTIVSHPQVIYGLSWSKEGVAAREDWELEFKHN